MKPINLIRFLMLASLLLGSTYSSRAETLLTCTGLPGGDLISRGFYVPHFPGITLDSARLKMSSSEAGTYTVRLTVRESAYNGAILGTSTRSIAFSGDREQNLPVTFSFRGISIAKGSRVCFALTKQIGTGELYYGVADWTNGCPEVVQTSGTAAPLSTFRRNGVDLQLTGQDSSIVGPGGLIQGYIDAADPGDVVIVQAGNYNENLTLRSDVSVRGAGYASTILTGLGSGDVVSAVSVTNSQFEGFTITGSGNAGGDAGVSINGGNVLFSNNRIANNLNGVQIVGFSSAILRNNVIENNGNAANGVVEYALSCLNSTPLIANNLIVNNDGNGIYIARVTSNGAQIINNTVSDNLNDGLYCLVDTQPIVKNNIFSGNANGITATTGASPRNSFNNVWGNSGLEYRSVAPGNVTVGLGDISADPLFNSASTPPYTLLEGSPCIDTGDPATVYRDPDGTRNDMGAFGGPTAFLPGLLNPVTSGFLFNTIGKIPTSEITQTGTGTGLANVSPSVSSALGVYPHKDAPFGGRLWLNGLYGINNASVTHYRVYAARWTSATPPAISAFQPLNNPLSKIKYTVSSSGSVSATLEQVGPNDNGLYLRTDRPTSGYWSHPDLKMIWDTRGMPNGRYDIMVKSYSYILGFPFEVTLPENDLSRITIHVDNEGVVASIDSVRNSLGNPIPECGMIPVANNQEEIQFEISAGHANGFLRNYVLDVVYGRNHHGGVVASDTYAGSNDSFRPYWAGFNSSVVSSVPAHALATLNPWTTCAYQFRLRVWARTTDGFSHIYKKTFSDHYFVNVGGGSSSSCPGDLDGDGDVDGQDLILFGTQFGTTNCISTPSLP